MAEQIIDPAKPTMSSKDRETILQGHAQTYASPSEEDIETVIRKIERGWGPEPGRSDGDLRDTNLLPFRPVTRLDLRDFMSFCGPVSGMESKVEYSSQIGESILKVTDAYLRQICLFVNSHSPVRNARADYPTMAYLPHDFWEPPSDPPTEEYIEDRARFIRTTARLPPQRLENLTHLFIHITPRRSSTDIKPNSALIVITPRAATIEYLDQLDHPGKHQLIGDIMNVISRVDPDRHSTWLELADWKCRAGASGGRIEIMNRPADQLRGTQILVCTNALAQAFGHDVNMPCEVPRGAHDDDQSTYDLLMWRRAIVIALDLYRGYFSNVIGDPQYKPRVKRMYGHRPHKQGDTKAWIDCARQRRNGPPWLHFSPFVHERLLDRELAQWNAENIWRGLDEEQLEELARLRERNPARMGRYYNAPRGAELGEFGPKMKLERAKRLRMWLEDADLGEERRVSRYHHPDCCVGWKETGDPLG
ncbi:hypothetical protein DSL72_001964 [Monilinia vaccinii-corymbosi]|uniref:Uncharacterized protein n=1 Tax=Monilinia vaccinii-corymbosi TaxID=61207 RepID=A0A8A3PBA5_9HELO|nr:hypothetical protein DSL72_001964 [Monilinia vaccinii-corymbosi]